MPSWRSPSPAWNDDKEVSHEKAHRPDGPGADPGPAGLCPSACVGPPADEEALAAYNEAFEAKCWFTLTTLPVDHDSEPVVEGEDRYYLAADERFPTMDALRTKTTRRATEAFEPVYEKVGDKWAFTKFRPIGS